MPAHVRCAVASRVSILAMNALTYGASGDDTAEGVYAVYATFPMGFGPRNVQSDPAQPNDTVAVVRGDPPRRWVNVYTIAVRGRSLRRCGGHMRVHCSALNLPVGPGQMVTSPLPDDFLSCAFIAVRGAA
jgi:hypothetical protein